MNININDPKWTDYALDEITDERERLEMEAVIRQSPEIAALVEEIRETAGWLKGEFAAEPAEQLTPEQRERIEAKAAKSAKTSYGGFLSGLFGWKPAWGYALAAAVIVVAFIAIRPFWQTEISRPEPILTAEVSEKSLSEQIQTAGLKDYGKPEPPSIPDVQPRAGAVAKSDDAQKTVSGKIQTGALGGSVLAVSQAVLPGATITAINTATNAAAKATADNSGVYNFPDLQAGTYNVTAEAPGFQRSVMKDVQLHAYSQSKLDFDLAVAGTMAEVELIASAESITLEIPPPMDEPLLFATNMAITTGISTSVREADTTLLPTMVVAAPPPPPRVQAKSAPIESYVTLERLVAASGVMSDVTDMSSARAETAFAGVPADNINITRDGISVSEVRGKARVAPLAQAEKRREPNPRPGAKFNTEDYEPIRDNPFMDVTQNPLSTFSIDVDTASYSNMRRFLNNGSLPPKDSIRIEELVNYFDYDYKAPNDGKPFAANVEMTEAPWNPQHRLLRIGLKGREIAEGKRPESNLVFLIDVSGSMDAPNRLPLVKDSMKMLVDRLTESDRVAIVIYAGDTRLLLPSTRGDQKAKLRGVIDSLRAGGSTNGASGIQLAYQAAQENFIKGGVNRVILATDGDFNVGVTNRGDLTRLIEEKAKSGIFLSALGFGMGNYKDTTLELLADKGRGNYAYIDTESEARKVLVEQINSTLVAIAKDVKIQVEFNPRLVKSYRLLGYENRVMAKEDFNDDAKMAGVIGAGHVVTAFYELELAGESGAKPGVDPLKYQKPPQASAAAGSREIATVKIRSKEPEKETSVLTEFAVNDDAGRFANASGDFKFAAAVASFGMMLRDSPHKGNADFERVLEWAKAGKGEDRSGYREEFIRLVHRAASF